jgi:hypothetical protein
MRSGENIWNGTANVLAYTSFLSKISNTETDSVKINNSRNSARHLAKSSCLRGGYATVCFSVVCTSMCIQRSLSMQSKHFPQTASARKELNLLFLFLLLVSCVQCVRAVFARTAHSNNMAEGALGVLNFRLRGLA